MAFPTATVTQGTGLTINTLPNAGQDTMANSLPVAIASNQSAFPITQPDPTAITGTISVVDAATVTVVNALGQSVVTTAPTATSSVSATVSGESVARIMLVGSTFNGTILFERSVDGGTTFLGTSVVAPGVAALQTSAVFTGAASTQFFDVNLAATTQFRVRCSVRSAGTLAVTIQPGYGIKDIALPGGVGPSTNTIGKVGIDQSTPGTTNGVQVIAGTTGGETPYTYLAAASANQDSQVVKASVGTIGGYDLFNASAAVRYVKLYDASSGPTSGSTPVRVFLLPAGGGVSRKAAIAFATGISFRITTGIANNDANAATANDVIVNIDYK